jgi:MFS family permease
MLEWTANVKRFSARAQGEPASEEAPEGELSPAQPKSKLPHAFTALRHYNYRLYWFGQLVSLMGTFVQVTGQAWLVLELTHSAWQLGLVGALQYLPILLFTLFGGVFADRWPKRSVLFVTQSAAMLQALLLWALTASGTVQLWQVYVLAALLGITNSLDQPTRSAFVVEMVGREDLPNAVAMGSSLANLAYVIGPSLGGILIAWRGVTPLFLLNALSFLAVLVALSLMRPDELQARPNAGERQNTWRSLREGVAYARNTPVVLLVTLVGGLVLLLCGNYNVVMPLFATDVLHVGPVGYGLLSAALGLGALLAALWQALGNRRPTVRRVLIGLLAYSGLMFVFALSRIFPLSLAVLAGAGIAETTCGMLATTLLQTVAPDHLRGRVISIYIVFFMGSIVPGYLLAGWLASRFGVAIGLLTCATLAMLVIGAGWLWRKPAEQSAAASAHH